MSYGLICAKPHFTRKKSKTEINIKYFLCHTISSGESRISGAPKSALLNTSTSAQEDLIQNIQKTIQQRLMERPA